MRRWNTPEVNIMHALLFLLNAGLGVLHVYQHRPWHLVAISFSSAGVILGLNIYFALLRRQVEGQIQEIRARRQQMIGNDDILAYKKAKENLERVAKNLGAQLNSVEYATISIRGDHFEIAPHQICRTQKSGAWKRTCLRQPAMPGPEMVAATLLLLHNDPTIFERWCRQDGWYS